MFKKIEVNIPCEGISSNSSLCQVHERYYEQEEGVMSLSTTYSVVIQKNLTMKMQHLGSFIIPYTIGNYEFGRALCDSIASINLMPLSNVKRLSLGELNPTTMTLQMANISMAHPEGILEDVLIKVGNFIFPGDFVVIDM